MGPHARRSAATSYFLRSQFLSLSVNLKYNTVSARYNIINRRIECIHSWHIFIPARDAVGTQHSVHYRRNLDSLHDSHVCCARATKCTDWTGYRTAFMMTRASTAELIDESREPASVSS